MFPSLPGSSARRGRTHDDHKFTRIRSTRGSTTETETNTNRGTHGDEGDEEEARHTNIYSTSLRFPLPSSFPRIYSLAEGPSAESCSVTTNLRMSSSIGDWIQGLERIACRAVGVDEREELKDGLRGMAEGYAWGFESDSEDGGGGGDDYE